MAQLSQGEHRLEDAMDPAAPSTLSRSFSSSATPSPLRPETPSVSGTPVSRASQLSGPAMPYTPLSSPRHGRVESGRGNAGRHQQVYSSGDNNNFSNFSFEGDDEDPYHYDDNSNENVNISRPTRLDDEYDAGEEQSPDAYTSTPRYSKKSRRFRDPTRTALRRVQRVSRHAALTTKHVVWDSNDASISAALSAVDQWEVIYTALKELSVASAHSAGKLYQATKDGAGKLEHGLLIPVRDWIILPAFGGVEKAVAETVRFIQSEQAKQLAGQSLEVVKQVPVVGENVLAPSLTFWVQFVQRTWEIVQYPIPSKQQVRDTVDATLTGTKWALSVAAREVGLYAKRADANITRTLSHTQWKVLGSGPYDGLDKLTKADVVDHLCERYLNLTDPVARYELAAHMRTHNISLYRDLIASGLLQQRGGSLLSDDEWLTSCPIYRMALEEPFLLPPKEAEGGHEAEGQQHFAFFHEDDRPAEVAALWFRLPYFNGQRPPKDAPWVCFRRDEQYALEGQYRRLLVNGQGVPDPNDTDIHIGNDGSQNQMEAGGKQEDRPEPTPVNELFLDRDEVLYQDPLLTMEDADDETRLEPESTRRKASLFPTIAKWYSPDLSLDVMVDQRRHAVSFFYCCPKCRKRLSAGNGPGCIPTSDKEGYGKLCPSCKVGASQEDKPWAAHGLHSVPPVSAVMRPSLWRFHGPGDEVRRATWFLDTSRHGLQPFDEEAQAILEDAYLFLKWMSIRQAFQNANMEDALLTVEVPCPDGRWRLVQFSSLTKATAIQKGVGSAIALFHRRVYRGAWLEREGLSDKLSLDKPPTIEENILQAVEDNGTLGETVCPNVSIRSIFTTQEVAKESRLVLHVGMDEVTASMAVPPARLREDGMARFLYDDDNKDDKPVDHLVLIVHGIGEMLRSVDVFGLPIPNLASMIDCVGFLRKNHAEVQQAHLHRLHPTHIASTSPEVELNQGRVEYLPVEWHEAFNILSQRKSPLGTLQAKNNIMLRDITLRTIPNMRDFANYTLMDVLYFMSPEHHNMIIDAVANEMNVVVEKFKRITGFDGHISIVGHSLGSIITWDILSNLKAGGHEVIASRGLNHFPSVESLGSLPGYVSPMSDIADLTLSYARNREESAGKLDFEVENFFLLGSPVAVFLMIRNQRKPLDEDFYLPGCRRVFNIFHPYDPVAYRLEPCIDSRNANFEPTILRHWNGGFRVQYQTKRLWRKFMQTTWRTQQDVVKTLESSMATIGLLGSSIENVTDDDASSDPSSDETRSTVRIRTGQLNQGRRIDFMLQEKEIEAANEYVAALAAHSSYWIEKDLSLFIARQIYLSALERAASAAEQMETEQWESIPAEMAETPISNETT